MYQTLLRFSFLSVLTLGWFEAMNRLFSKGDSSQHTLMLTFIMMLVFTSSLLVLFGAQWWVRWLLKPGIVRQADERSDFSSANYIIHRQANLLGIPVPILHVYESDDLNAFIVGGIRKRQHLYLSQTLLVELNQDEIEAVIAHEMAHIFYRDIIVNETFYGMGMACQYGLQYIFAKVFALFKKSEHGPQLAKHLSQILTYGILLLPLWFIVLLYGRKSEYRADALASQLVGHQQYLWMLYRLKSIGMKNIISFSQASEMREYFASHPTIHHRISALESR